MRVQVTGKGSGFMASGSRADFPVMCNEAGTYDFKSLSESRDSSNWIASTVFFSAFGSVIVISELFLVFSKAPTHIRLPSSRVSHHGLA